MDRRLQLRRAKRFLRGGLSESQREIERDDPPVVDCLRYRRPADREQSQAARVAYLHRGKAHRYRNPGRAYVAGLAAESVGVRAAAVQGHRALRAENGPLNRSS